MDNLQSSTPETIPLYQRPWVFAEDTTELDATDDNGKTIKVVSLAGSRIGIVREGSGKDVENASQIAGKDKRKYMSALMAACIEIEGQPVVMEDLALTSMKDYMRLQVAFADLNF